MQSLYGGALDSKEGETFLNDLENNSLYYINRVKKKEGLKEMCNNKILNILVYLAKWQNDNWQIDKLTMTNWQNDKLTRQIDRLTMTNWQIDNLKLTKWQNDNHKLTNLLKCNWQKKKRQKYKMTPTDLTNLQNDKKKSTDRQIDTKKLTNWQIKSPVNKHISIKRISNTLVQFSL